MVNSHDQRGAVFDQLRSTLFGIAFEIVGHYSECEAVMAICQQQWAELDRSEVNDAESYLVRLLTRVALDTVD